MQPFTKKRIGILGGTFNPIHIGHLILAEYAYEKFDLEKVFLMPAGNPPHKNLNSVITTKQRIVMTSLAIAGNKNLELSTIETDRDEITYTCDTLTCLHGQHPDTEFYFILGADSLFNIETWKNPGMICRYATLIAAVRDDMNKEEIEKQIQYLKQKYNAVVYLLDTPNIEISSKMIRSRVHDKKTIKYLVHPDVEAYIYKNKLYDIL